MPPRINNGTYTEWDPLKPLGCGFKSQHQKKLVLKETIKIVKSERVKFEMNKFIDFLDKELE